MPVMDEFREERAALKTAPFKEKLSYFLDYYKWHVILTVTAIVVVTALVSQILSRKDTAFYLALINAVDTTSAELPDYDFTKHAGIDTEECEIVYDTSMCIDFSTMTEYSISSAEKFVTHLAAAQLDVVISDEDIIRKYAHNETFYDLTRFLTEEQIEKYEPYFYYMDYSVLEAINAAQDAYDYDFVPEYPDPRRPEAMEKPVPVGLYVTDCPALTDRFQFTRGDSGVILSVVLNTTRPEMVSLYIDFLMEN